MTSHPDGATPVSVPAPSPEVPTRDDLEREILGESPSLTSADVMGSGNASAAEARRLWRALGFADAGEAAAFTQADAQAMAMLDDLVSAGTLDFDMAVRLTRAVGHTMARLADWQVSTLTERVEDLERSGRGTGSRLATGLDFVRSIEPSFEHLMVYAWRRHLAAAVSRVEALGANDANLHTQTRTVGFADLVSFTRLSSGIDNDRLADVVEGFESVCSDLVAGRGGRIIKTLGDSVLFIAERPRLAVDIASDIVEEIGADPALPDVHVGLATGPIVMRLGDVFGSPVNLASRLTAVARRNRVIGDTTTAEALRGTPGFSLRPLTERSLRGFGMVQPVAIKRLREPR
ncbi:MAG: adenylate cyclase [Nocardioidaceae bacterium]|nr:adenylate cyclase [Nocardioidaceae bacterium]